jgi:hypothetical protein
MLEPELVQLLSKASLAPEPSPTSSQYQDHVRQLDMLEHRLEGLKRSLSMLQGQGPGYFGPREDPYRAKQREASFDDLTSKVEELLASPRRWTSS